MAWDTVAEKFLDLLKAFLPSKKLPIRIEISDIIKSNIVRLSGAHRVTILEVKNGGSDLSGDKDMFISVLFCYEDERYIKKLPEFNNVKIDWHFRSIIRRTIDEDVVALTLGEVPEGTFLYEGMFRYGSNLSEYHLLKNDRKKAYFLVLATTIIERNPFDKYRMETNLEINKIKKYFNK